ncbi:MAG: hypothetical protein A2V87_02110 [Deltaproteobacteria bacterium RBG_16_58_17]|nr:MAG: hypothetical protein A2V87_02110 [Deltaproteobacteria bacterium RBG_16_58_17]OHE17146.1 MAG: hypothetical protein A2X96_05245 [Syntrophobacterales bacterium GWC2_56_13]OHE19946.1 MAG: hypothetical protein A2X95_07635 [Syntrophobacterales bacterium GWF2_56_9]
MKLICMAPLHCGQVEGLTSWIFRMSPARLFFWAFAHLRDSAMCGIAGNLMLGFQSGAEQCRACEVEHRTTCGASLLCPLFSFFRQMDTMS